MLAKNIPVLWLTWKLICRLYSTLAKKDHLNLRPEIKKKATMDIFYAVFGKKHIFLLFLLKELKVFSLHKTVDIHVKVVGTK